MDFLFANLFPILLILIFVVSGIVRLIFRKKRFKKGKSVPDKIETQTVKPDDERRLKFERLKSSNIIGYSAMSEESIGGIGVLEGRQLNEEKLDVIERRKLKGLKTSDFKTEELGRIHSDIESVSPMEWDNTGETEKVKVSFVTKLSKLKPFARAIIWKEILDRPKSENF